MFGAGPIRTRLQYEYESSVKLPNVYGFGGTIVSIVAVAAAF
jgi:hypothetical protein